MCGSRLLVLQRVRFGGAYGIPDLQLNLSSVDVDHSRSKFHSDGEVMHRLEPLVRELQK